MKLRWKNTEQPYEGLFPNAVMIFSSSYNNAIMKIRRFDFTVYPSINHLHLPLPNQWSPQFTETTGSTTIFTDGHNEFTFDDSFTSFKKDGQPYQPLGDLQTIVLGYPKYYDIGKFIEEVNDQLILKLPFTEYWLLAQEFNGEPLGTNWELM